MPAAERRKRRVCIPGNRAKGVGNGLDDDVTAVVVE
jgi:hypothetical protein